MRDDQVLVATYTLGERRWLDPATGFFISEGEAVARYPQWFVDRGSFYISNVDREARSITMSYAPPAESVPSVRSFYCPRWLQPLVFWFLRRFGGR